VSVVDPGSREPVTKALELLSHLIDLGNTSVGVRELASRSSMPASTVHRILGQLEKLSLVQRDQAGRYSLGLELLRWGQRLAPIFPLREAATPRLQQLVDSCNETAFLGVYNPRNRQMMYTASIESKHPLRYNLPMEEWRPLYAGASGLAILAFLPPAEQKSVIEQAPLVPVTRNTITDRKRLRTVLTQILNDGVAVTRGENIPGAVGVAAPLFDSRLEVIGDVCLTIPEQRFDDLDEVALRRQVIECVQDISDLLGANIKGETWPPTPERAVIDLRSNR